MKEESEAAARSCAGEIARALVDLGLKRVYGHPGGETVDLMQALIDHGLDFVLTGHESAAAFAASTEGRLTGRPGACLATLGPGACNLVCGVAAAYLDRDPVLAISAITAASQGGWMSKQNLDLHALFRPITKETVAIDGKGSYDAVLRAAGLAAEPPYGPVYLSVPSDTCVLPEGAAEPRAPSPEPTPPGWRLETIRSALLGAKAPVAVVGSALDRHRDGEGIRLLLMQSAVPFVCLPQAKGIADELAPGFLGCVATAAGDTPYLTDYLRGSDCLLGLGFDPVETGQSWHRTPPVHSLAYAPTGFGSYRPRSECIGPVGKMAEALARLLGDWRAPRAKAALSLRERVAGVIRPRTVASSKGLSPFHVLETLQGDCPEDLLLTSDVGSHKVLLAQSWRALDAKALLITNGLSAMGYGIPAAIAACLELPRRPVACVVGDGGLGMMVQELATIRRLGIAPLIVAFCDGSLSLIKLAQSARQLPYQGVDLGPVDWVKVSEGFGVAARPVDTLAGLRDGVAAWRGSGLPMLLAVAIDDALYEGLTY